MSRRTAQPRLAAAATALALAVVAAVGWLLRRPCRLPARAPSGDVPWDDEPVTPDDDAAIAESEAEVARGEFLTLDELEAELAGRKPSAWAASMAGHHLPLSGEGHRQAAAN